MTTISFSVKPEEYSPSYQDSKQIVSNNNYYDKEYDTILYNSPLVNCERARFNNGLVGTVFTAYSKHIPLELRPDDLWLAISFAFGHYVEKHSEEMRDIFVNHEGKEKIQLVCGGSLKTVSNWDKVINTFSKEIEKRVNNDFIKWLRPNFSTTTSLDIVVCDISIMNAMKNYFSYGMSFLCGLSELTLHGNIEDWELLVEKTKKLYGFKIKDLTTWTDLLIPILEKFVDAKKQIVDEDFWQKICKSQNRGSGGHVLTGWISVFCPFDKTGNLVLNKQGDTFAEIDLKDIYCSTSNIEVDIDDNGVKKDVIIYGGQLATRYENKTLSVQSGYVIIEKKTLDLTDIESLLQNYINQHNESIIKRWETLKEDIRKIEKELKETTDEKRMKILQSKITREQKKRDSIKSDKIYTEDAKNISKFTYQICKLCDIPNNKWRNSINNVQRCIPNMKNFNIKIAIELYEMFSSKLDPKVKSLLLQDFTK